MTEFEGQVTSSFSSYGIVDEEIYFDYNVITGDLPALGSRVRGTKELHGEDAYRATSLEVVEEVELARSELSGRLARINGDLGYVEVERGQESVPFKLSHCTPRPAIGDLLTLQLEEINGVLIGSSVSHIRKRRFTSLVLKVSSREGELEDSAYFTSGVCPNGYKPQPNDIVTGSAVECVFKDFVWRVFEMKPSSSTFYNMKTPMSLYRLPRFCMSKVARECERGGPEDIISCSPVALRIGHLNPADTVELEFSLTNNTANVLITLTSITASDNSIVKCNFPLPRYLYPGVANHISLCFTNTDIGQHNTTLRFLFSVNDKLFSLSRRLHINVVPPKTKECLRARTSEPFLAGSQVIPGLRPERKNPRFYPNHFPSYSIPEDVTAESEDRHLAAELSLKNYKYIMHKLLFMEERYIEEEMRNYSIYETSLMKRGRFLALHVPGLVESKLSILIGHRVMLEHPGNKIKYEGYVHKIDEEKEDILLGFDTVYHESYGSENVNIHFNHSRTSFVRCHLAIDFIVKQGERVIFPTCVNVKPPHFNLGKLELFNTQLNREQEAAVKHMIEAKARPLPYLLFGPPGTGKTVTIVEAILQIYHLQEDSRILVAAPSNSACDLVAERLLSQLPTLDIVRLNSLSRYTEHLSEELQAISLPADEVKEASLKRVIIATCITAGNLYKLGLRTSHFTHVFIDEAGQAIEPEVILPIALSTGPGTQAVLAGDPYQLGPVIKNPQCEVLGLQVSLLERLMDLDIYERKEQYPDNNYYDPVLLTKLVRNYRSHPDLLTVPSQLFYDNELVPCAPDSLVGRAVGGPTLPNPSIPLILHGLRGEEMREHNNPSLYNPTEIVQVLTYVKQFLKAGFSAQEIGVITPYKKQAEKMRMMMQSVRDIDARALKVASVEDFQGQERPVIIISTVRSNNSLPTDRHRLLGFLRNPKRFNVAITRAQAALVVVGNPDVLKWDEHWNVLVEYAMDMGCYVGCEFSRREEEGEIS